MFTNNPDTIQAFTNKRTIASAQAVAPQLDNLECDCDATCCPDEPCC